MICAWSFVLAPARSKFKQQKHTKSSTFVGCWSLRFICSFHKLDDKLINDRLKNLFNNNVSSSVGNVSRQYFIMFCMFAAFNFYHSFIECFFSCIFFFVLSLRQYMKPMSTFGCIHWCCCCCWYFASCFTSFLHEILSLVCEYAPHISQCCRTNGIFYLNFFSILPL